MDLGLLKSIAIESVSVNVTINNLIPERFDTPRQEFMAKRRMANKAQIALRPTGRSQRRYRRADSDALRSSVTPTGGCYE